MKAGIMVRARSDFRVFNTKHQAGNTYLVISSDEQHTILGDHPLFGSVTTFPVPADRIEIDFESIPEPESNRLINLFGYNLHKK
jgi:hypothetical protein